MSDRGTEVEFGLFPTPNAASLRELLDLVQLAEVRGLDIVSIQDHPYQRNHVDTWTLLSFLGARTSTIRLSPNVANLPLRPPVVLAKSAATLDVLTGGRVELGVGAGAFWDAIVAAGGPRRTPGEAVAALAEAISIIRAFFGGRSVAVDGEHYTVRGLRPGPLPAHPIPIWVGAVQPRMLRLTGRLADAWIPSLGYVPPQALPELNRIIDEAAVRAGRSPGQVRRLYNIHGGFGTGGGFLQGRPREWAEQLAELTLGAGMTGYILASDDPDEVRRFADEVAPQVREFLAGAAPSGEPDAASRLPPPAGAPDAASRLPTPAGDPAASAGFAVSPTPDDGVRLTGELAWDEASRPEYRGEEGTARPHAAAAQHLVDVHDGLRAELERVRDIVRQVRAGQLDIGRARSAINTMSLRQNNWTLGAYCASYCRVVTTHHSIEDFSIFPHLRRAEAGLAPVIDRLEAEHHVIHDVLNEVDEALVDLARSDGAGSAAALETLQGKVDLMTDTLLSHLAYEERELLEPLARHGFS